jgi:hypothetical protein
MGSSSSLRKLILSCCDFRGKLGLKTERDGPYLLLRGLRKLLTCLATLALLKQAGLLDGLLELLDTL